MTRNNWQAGVVGEVRSAAFRIRERGKARKLIVHVHVLFGNAKQRKQDERQGPRSVRPSEQ